MPNVDDDEKWDKLMERLRHLPPLRNINAIRTWMEVCAPTSVPMFDRFVKDAAKGATAPKRVLIFMMVAFAAGRAYQAANPDAARDPDGYGG